MSHSTPTPQTIQVHGKKFPAQDTGQTCAVCDEAPLVKYRDHYGWKLACQAGCGCVEERDAQTLH